LSLYQPNTKLVRVTDAATEPLSLDDAKNFLRVTITDDDALISGLISSARYECERLVDRSFITTTWKLTMDYFPPYSSRFSTLLPPAIVGPQSDRNYWLNLSSIAIELPMPPLIEVTSITYIDPSGTTQPLDPSEEAQNVTVSAGTPGQMVPYYGKIFPVTQPTLSAVNITYTAGYGPDATDVPPPVIAAMRFLVAMYYEHRTDSVPTPEVVKNLLASVYWGNYS
jgi:Phage gp6-like head-tail connector protein